MADDRFFARYRGCVFSNRSAELRVEMGRAAGGDGKKPGSAELRVEMDLSLEELREQGQGRDIFPPRAIFALRSAFPMGYTLPR